MTALAGWSMTVCLPGRARDRAREAVAEAMAAAQACLEALPPDTLLVNVRCRG
ncbi:hypothetical protein ACGFZK_05545 [Streptomyces sp. NPDC048257]|uniref:hypothetical protein n=1 Tax=Streptomyces sp. NPDC048257 TaxID=3365526 RepID=UPI0037115747